MSNIESLFWCRKLYKSVPDGKEFLGNVLYFEKSEGLDKFLIVKLTHKNLWDTDIIYVDDVKKGRSISQIINNSLLFGLVLNSKIPNGGFKSEHVIIMLN